jgi:hypothetical protein
MKKLSVLVLLFTGLIGILADGSQIASFVLDLCPKIAPGGNSGPITGPGTGGGLAHSIRPTHLVLVVENVGETDYLDPLIGPLLDRLIPDDRVSVIAFTDSGPREIIEATTGDDIRSKIGSKLRHLVPVRKLSREDMERAVNEARRRLELSRDGKVTSTIMVLSAQTTQDLLRKWFARIRTDHSALPLRFGTRAGEGNRG